jgi:hypothetical protein
MCATRSTPTRKPRTPLFSKGNVKRDRLDQRKGKDSGKRAHSARVFSFLVLVYTC